MERIASLSNNIALSLKATSVRVQAPIPGKGVVGVEIPNATAKMVCLREILESDAWQASKAKLPIVLGKDVAGNNLIADLADMPLVILLGLVVNNAILLVMQTRTGQRDGLDTTDAVAQAVRVRARPIYMSTLTSIFGMLPLMLVPGVGSQIYRGLATVIVGGMIVSAIFTLILMPSVLRLPPVRLPRFARSSDIKGVPADA